MPEAEPPAGLLLRAAACAAEYHRGQRRKDRQATPYINHPVRVAALLAGAGGVTDPDVLAAALLHDTVEDTEATLGDIERAFGPRVRQYVAEVSDDKSLPKGDRKAHQIEDAPGLCPQAKLIKLADKIDNVGDLASHPPRDWSAERVTAYLDWADQVVAALGVVNGPLEQRFRDVLAAARG